MGFKFTLALSRRSFVINRRSEAGVARFALSVPLLMSWFHQHIRVLKWIKNDKRNAAKQPVNMYQCDFKCVGF